VRARIRARRYVLVLSIAAACSGGCFASTAAAEFGPVQLISKSAKEQAEFAEQPALSADGNFVAFFGELGGHVGIFRKDLSTGALTLVAERRHAEEVMKAPSISGEGRFVSFTTTQSLVPADEGETEDVYVADLAVSPPAYRLVSAVGPVGEEERMSGASSAAGRVALDADGSEVAFVNEGQVYVRDLAATEPTLISVKKGAADPEPVVGGGAYQPSGVALSADGNAVAWVGDHLPEQVPLLAEEEQKIKEFDQGSTPYHEPLWREVPTPLEPNPPTRRIVGGGDPTAPGCPAGGLLSEQACQGPFPKLDENPREERVFLRIGRGWGIGLPQLSADGLTVALTGSPQEFEDLFVIDMAPGLSRVQALQQLTKWTNPNPAARLFSEIVEYTSYVGPIEECAISPDGSEVAFTTPREYFPGSSLVTPLPAVPPQYPELYQVNVERRTIERVTPGPGTAISLPSGGVGETRGGAEVPSYGRDGRRLIFADLSYNLVAGDANERSDVYLVESTPPGPIEPSRISPPPSKVSVIPSWRLSARAISLPDGAVRVIAAVPGSGTLRAAAKSPLGARLRLRGVDHKQRTATAGGVVQLELKLPRKFRKLAHRKGGLYTWLNLRFWGPGGAPLQQQFPSRFRAHRAKRARGKKK